MSFVFYDVETTGLRVGFDQIVQFAAIRTDNDLNELERFEVRSHLLPHVVPHPLALLTNGMPIERLTDQSVQSHYQMVVAINQKLLQWSPAIFAGFNSIRFDEEMLRQALFQTMHDAYLTSKHGNCRADVLGLALSAAALESGVIRVPRGDDGRPVFRLEQLASANEILPHKFHDAMEDAQSTLQLCRIIKNGAPQVWQRFVRFSKKAAVADFVDEADGFVLTQYFGNEAYHAPVVCVGPDPDLRTRRICLRLDIGIADLINMSDVSMQEYFAKRPSPIRTLRINAAPTLTDLFDATDAMIAGMDLGELEERGRRIKDDEALLSKIINNYVATRPKRERGQFPEQRIHDQFPDDQDSARMNSFHNVSWPDALKVVNAMQHPDLRTFGRRLIYFEARSVLSAPERSELEVELTGRLVIETDQGFTLEQARVEVEALVSSGADANEILIGYRKYLTARLEKVVAYRRDHLSIDVRRA